MAGFLRKKSKQEPAPKPAPAAPPPSAPTPLYARFGASSAAPPSPTTSRIVSGPMALGKRESISHPRNTASGARRNVTGPAASSTSLATTKSGKYGVKETSGDAAFGDTDAPPAWRPPARANTRKTTTLGPAFGDDAPTPPPSKRDKPLPNIYPPREPSDLLSSVPPQSTLPPSRRFSNRVVPPETYNSRTATSGQVSDHSAALVSIPSSSVLPPADPEKPLFPHESLFSTPKARPIPTPDRNVSVNAHQPRIPTPASPPQRRAPHELDSTADLEPPLARSDTTEISQAVIPQNISQANSMSTTTTTTMSPTAYHMNGPPRKSNSQRSLAAPARGKPLIFAAMTTIPQPQSKPRQNTYPHNSPPQQQHVYRPPYPNSYPTPPAEYSQPRSRQITYPSPPPNPYPSMPLENSHPPVAVHQHLNSSTASLPRHRNGASSTNNDAPRPPSRDAYPNGSLNGHAPGQTARMETHPPVSLQNTTPPRAAHSKAPSRTPSDTSMSMVSRRLHKQRPVTPEESREVPFFADDPFAKVEGVKLLPPKPSPSKGKEREVERPFTPEVVRPVTPARPVTPEAATPEVVRPVTPPPAPRAPPTPPSPEDYKRVRRGHVLEKSPPQALAALPVKEDRPPEPFLLDVFLSHAGILAALLPYLSFYEWLVLSSVTKKIRSVTSAKGDADLKEVILERYLKTVGYSRWLWGSTEPLVLTLEDLYHYMRGVTLPTHEYARTAQTYVQTHASRRERALVEDMQHLTAATRSYTRVVLRLRAQAEKETSRSTAHSPSSRTRSRASSRAPSPTFSYSTHGHRPPTPINHGFKSPLFRLRRAPLLRCFVPSPDGDWLSDASVLECEAELKRAGVMHLMRVGDVVWDIAVGDEGNVGRLVWDGSYLIDLDYTYSAVGDLPRYLPTLAFSPSYFHRVVRTGPASSNPIVRIDLAPWGEEIAANLQLLQDRVRTETPQGTYHNVVRWVHRSSFVLRSRGAARIAIPESNGLFVDPGWYGTVVVETEGTNESLADLQERCGPGAFPPRVGGVRSSLGNDRDSRLVFRILREKSRPGEIWIRTVGPKERLN